MSPEKEDILEIGGRVFKSRLFIGTGKFSSGEIMRRCIIESGASVVTVAFRRIDVRKPPSESPLLKYLTDLPDVLVLPNTSGARNHKEAVLIAELSASLLGHKWVKVEIHPDPRNLMPDPIETYTACKILVEKGFMPMPYVHADPVLCKRLEDVGVPCVMPLGSPIGTNRGLETLYFLEQIIKVSSVPVIIDAGLGAPSHAALAMEIGADAVLVNTAISVAGDPVAMARAFALAVKAGRMGYLAGLPPISEPSPTSPVVSILQK